MNDQEIRTGDSLSDRAISGFPLSIGTSLSMESIFTPKLPPYDPERKAPVHIELTDYQEIWINCSTLIRNIVSAISKETFLHADVKEIKDVLDFEIEVINSLFLNEGNGTCVPKYYYCTYTSLYNFTDKAIRFKLDKTDFQKFYRVKHDKAIAMLAHNNDAIHRFGSSIKPHSKSSSIVLTHIPYDLLSYKNFTKLDLLESNTGKLKSRQHWNSKYYPVPNADLSNLPFSKRLLLIFGDKAQIQPSDMRLRKLIIDTAKNRQWTPMTTDAKVMLDLSIDIKEPYVLKFVNSL